MLCNANPKNKKKQNIKRRMVTKSIEMKHKNQELHQSPDEVS